MIYTPIKMQTFIFRIWECCSQNHFFNLLKTIAMCYLIFLQGQSECFPRHKFPNDLDRFDGICNEMKLVSR